jgi:hypothetical protein
MPARQTVQAFNVVKAPYFEAVARSFVSQFGDDALRIIDITIERIEDSGPAFALDIWRDIRLALLRKSASQASVLLQ